MRLITKALDLPNTLFFLYTFFYLRSKHYPERTMRNFRDRSLRDISTVLEQLKPLNHDILKRHADQPTISREIAVPSQTLVRQSLRKQYSAARRYPQPHPILCRNPTTNTRRNTETVIDLLFSPGTLAATLTNYEIKKVKNKIKNKKGMETTKTTPKNKIKNKRSTN